MNLRSGMMILGCVGLLASSAWAEELDFNTAAAWKKSANLSVADGVLSIKGVANLESAMPFAVDAAKKYTLSFEIRKAPGSPATYAYVGFWPLNAAKRRIMPTAVFAVKDTETTLVGDAAKGVREITVVKPQNWPEPAAKRRYWGVVFEAKADMSDLPNYTYNKITAVTLEGANLKLTLNVPLAKAYAAGTALRIHSDGGSAMYSGWQAKQRITDEWQQASCTVTGMAESGLVDKNWRSGTKFATLMILGNYKIGDATMKDCTIEMKNIKLTIAE